jgi:esterase/lipase superfamily enzyme
MFKGMIKNNRKTARGMLIIGVLFSVCLSGCAPMQKTASTYMKDIYKRISYRISDHYRVLDVFYATTRGHEQDSESMIPFDSSLSDKTSLGKTSIKIDPSVTVGKMLPEKLKTSGKMGVESVDMMDDERFMEELAAAVDASPNKSLFILVFGYKDDFEETAIKAGWFAYMLDVNTPVLLFDWPGDQPVNIRGYNKARRYAEVSGPALGKLITNIVREIKPEKLWLKGSSLGCETICDAFEYMYQYDDMRDDEAELTKVILAAPDVSEDDFKEKFARHILAFSEMLTVYVSSQDDALLMSGMITGHKRLGRQRIKDPAQAEAAKDLLLIKSQHPGRLTVIDVTPINNSSFHHGYYLECPEFFDDLYARINGKGSTGNRRLYLLKYKGEVDYWVMQR